MARKPENTMAGKKTAKAAQKARDKMGAPKATGKGTARAKAMKESRTASSGRQGVSLSGFAKAAGISTDNS